MIPAGAAFLRSLMHIAGALSLPAVRLRCAAGARTAVFGANT